MATLIVPKSKPQLSRAEVETIIKDHKINEKVVLVGIRGYYKRTMGNPLTNDRGIYDDAIFVFAPTFFATYNANTDPSIFRKGIATLKEGVHYYKKGKHKILSPLGYAALRPATPDESLPVTRDGQTGTFKGIAINIHKGGYNTTSSEGCQTIYPNQWKSFQTSVYELMDRYNQKTIPYILISY